MNVQQAEVSNPLGRDKIGVLLARFGIPSVISMLVSALYNIVDQIFIGQGVGLLGNAATNVALPLTTISMSIALLLGVGGASNFNLELGAGNRDKAMKIGGNTLSLLAVCGVALCVLIRIFLNPLMLAFGSTELVLPYALTYTGITSFGFPFLILCSGTCNLIRADGSPKYSMVCMVTGAIINTILDPLFIFVFHWGIAGAAWATVIGQVVSCLIALKYLTGFRTGKFTRDCFRIRKKQSISICALGASSGFNQIAMMVVQIAMNNTMTHYGAQSVYGREIPLAVSGIIGKVNMILMAFGIGIAQGSQPIVGFNYGAKNYKRVKDTYRLGILVVTGIFTLGFLCFQLFPRQIIRIFGDGDELYYVFAARYFRIYLMLVFINGLQIVSSSFFTSIGKAFKGVILSLTRQIIFLLPLILCLPVFFGIDGVMFAGPIADGMAAITAVILVLGEMKKMRLLEESYSGGMHTRVKGDSQLS
ncbi:MATE family efflux transporter [Anaerolentibacter hominis]|uniref:MATE family efflux transporter n=1 Tax=Anaerolentibacter hominis TaxID=3079009 RepID=UPI0031B88B9F